MTSENPKINITPIERMKIQQSRIPIPVSDVAEIHLKVNYNSYYSKTFSTRSTVYDKLAKINPGRDLFHSEYRKYLLIILSMPQNLRPHFGEKTILDKKGKWVSTDSTINFPF